MLQRAVMAVRAGRTAGGVGVAAAAVTARDRADIDRTLRSHADPPVVGPDFLEERDGLDVLHAERKIDEAVGVIVSAAGRGRLRLRDRQECDPPGRIELHAVEHCAEDADAPERAAVVVRARDPARIGAGLDAAARDLEAARSDVRKPKRSRIGEQGQVDVRRDVGGERCAQRLDQREHELAARRR